MLDSFLSSPYRTEFSPWPVSEHYATERAGGVPEAMLLPGELTVHRGDGAKMSYYLDWPEEFNEYTRAITLRPHRTLRSASPYATARLSSPQPPSASGNSATAAPTTVSPSPAATWTS